MSFANLQSVGIRWVFLGSWCHLQSTPSTALTHCIQRKSFRQTCISASSLRCPTLPWTIPTAFSLCVSCLLPSYSWLALGVCFSDHGTICSQLPHHIQRYRGQDPLVEKYILKTLEWNMSYPNPIHFLHQISKVDECSVQVCTVAKYTLCWGEDWVCRPVTDLLCGRWVDNDSL